MNALGGRRSASPPTLSVIAPGRPRPSDLAQALVANAALQAPVHLAHTQIDYARVLGPGPEADRLIVQAASTAQRLGLGSVAQRAANPRGADSLRRSW
jgi:hypothetical protein